MSSSSTDEPLPSAWLERIAETLDAIGVEWVVAGALAVLRYRREGRFTTDLDLLVVWEPTLVERFEALGYDVRVHADRGSAPHLLMLRSPTERIDLIVACVPYQELALRRGLLDHVLTVEDVLVHKLIAWRPRDRDDVASILAAGHKLDEGYVERWSDEWDVGERWRRARLGDFAP